ncbi:GNAT family N-acetyltransferase [Cellulomonas sp. NPDC089187]|uniref:GNAT family N-acetyltransferase n=1 Tax=Cellulomonas sp. NPDC089187 TaxID=3154970 RepID=UPI003440CA9A
MTSPLAPTADVSVRPAIPGDEHAVAGVQLAAWQDTLAETLGEGVLDRIDVAQLAAQWAQAITAPPGPGFRVLVAMHGPRLVGFASVAPVTAPPEAGDDVPGGEILALEVLPEARRLGHGSRLLAAVVDLLRDEDRAGSVQTWVLTGDAIREQFLGAAGLDDMGAQRRLGTEGDPRELTERLWAAAI